MIRPSHARTALATAFGRAVGASSRRLGRGSGSTIGGRVALALDPGLLGRLASGRQVALVTGTNGKTTTTAMLTSALGGPSRVATSAAGANMAGGLVAALLEAPAGAPAALEIDERHLPRLLGELTPDVVVLLNVTRDQLDRVGEVRMTAAGWREALRDSAATVIANADDPLVVYAAELASNVVYVATGTRWRADAYHCPRCDSRILYSEDGTWGCRCGFCRPGLAYELGDEGLITPGGATLPVSPAVPGRFNRSNAAMAAVAAHELGMSLADALAATATPREVAGRFTEHARPGGSLRLLLAKNPAGFDELLDLVAEADRPVAIGINSRIADGHDPSWLYDVAFERLGARTVVATGERALDLGVRLGYAGVAHVTVADQRGAIAALGPGDADYVGNYTAFQDLRRELASKALVASAAMPKTLLPPAPGPGRARRASVLRIVLVHPDLLGTYGDGGNALVLERRSAWRGIDVELVLAPSDEALPESGDLYLLGGGEDGPQSHAAERLGSGALARAVAAGATVLAVCAGYQILGVEFPGPHGALPGLGLIDIVTVPGRPRAVGEILVRAGNSGGLSATTLTGFENHAGRTTRGSVGALGAVALGIGNGDGTDGAVSGRVIGTYLHGPVLARNAALADHLLRLATGAELGALPDVEEQALHGARIAAARVNRVPGRRKRARTAR